MEQQILQLLHASEEQRNATLTLQKKNISLEQEVMDGHNRALALAEENRELSGAMGTIRKHITKLETLRSAVLSSVQEQGPETGETQNTRHDFLKSVVQFSEPGCFMPHSMPPPSLPTPQQRTGTEHSVGSSTSSKTIFWDPSPSIHPRSPTFPPAVVPLRAKRHASQDGLKKLLNSIKLLNSGEQTRQDTLEDMGALFGSESHELLQGFEHLLHSRST